MLPTKPSYHKDKIKLYKFAIICHVKETMNKIEKDRE